MKTILLLIILINISLFSQWQEVERPKSVRALENIKTGSDFIVGSTFDPYFSFNGGETWEKRANGLPENRGAIEKIIVDDDVVYILINTTISIRNQNIMYSTDKGMNWLKLIDSLQADSYNLISDFAIENKQIYLLSSTSNYILKSSNFSEKWDTLTKWDSKFGIMRLIDVKNDSIVIASMGGRYSHGGIVNSSYLVSIDGGSTWEERSNQLSTSGLKCLKIHNNHIYVGGQEGFFYSEDFGNSWRSPGMMVVDADVRDIEILNDTVYLATENGLFRANDLFRGWEEIEFFKSKRVWEIHYGFEKIFVRSLNRDYSESKSFVSEKNNYFDYFVFNFLAESTLNSFYIDYPQIFIATDKIIKKEHLFEEDEILFETDTIFELTRLSVFNKNIIHYYLFTSSDFINRVFNYSIDEGKTWNKMEIDAESNNFNILNLFLLNNDTLLLTDRNKGVFISKGFSNDINQLTSGIIEIDELLIKVNNIIRRYDKIYFIGSGVIIESDTNLTNWKSYSNKLTSNNILNLSKNLNSIFTINLQGFNSKPETVKISVSRDEGISWKDINNLFPNYENIIFRNVFAIEKFVFVSSSNGIYFSRDEGETFEELNDGLSSVAKYSILHSEFQLYGDKILFCSSSGIFYRDLEELGITLSVENTETRNYLWTNPPYPQPTSSIVKVETYWDNALPFTEKDIEIYDITGVKINTENTLTIEKESVYKGKIIWDASNYKTGIYIMKITHGTETRVRKIMVVE